MGIATDIFSSLTDKYELGKTIGRGCFSKVKFGVIKGTNQAVAIKIIRQTESDVSISKGWRRQVIALTKLNHENIVKLYEHFESGSFMFMVMECAENGSLTEYFSTVKIRFTQEEAKKKFRQVALAVRHCHMNGIVHRDLKISNLVLDQNFNVKLVDFGFSTEFQPSKLLESFCGTPMFAPPEIFDSVPYDGFKVDVWSLGIILYRFVTGNLPFDGSDFSTLKEQVKNSIPPVPVFLNQLCRELINQMLTKNPQDRPDIEYVVNHSWFDSIIPYEPETGDRDMKRKHHENLSGLNIMISNKSNVSVRSKFGPSKSTDSDSQNSISSIRMGQSNMYKQSPPSQEEVDIELEELRMWNGSVCFPCVFHLKSIRDRFMMNFINKYFSKSVVRLSSNVYDEIRYSKYAFYSTEEATRRIECACYEKSVQVNTLSKTILSCCQNPETGNFLIFSSWEIHVHPPSMFNMNYSIKFYHVDGSSMFLDEFIEYLVGFLGKKV